MEKDTDKMRPEWRMSGATVDGEWRMPGISLVQHWEDNIEKSTLAEHPR